MLPVDVLYPGGLQRLGDKGIEIDLPARLEDVSPVRLRAFSDPVESTVELRLDRLWTPWTVAEIESALSTGGVFGRFEAAETPETGSSPASGARVRRVRGRDVSTGDARTLLYAVVERGPERVLARYEGPPDAVAYNRSVLEASIDSLVVAPC